MTEREAVLALSLIPGIGPVHLSKLVGSLGSAQAVLSAPLEQLAQVEGIGRALASTIRSFPWREALEEESRLIEAAGVSWVGWDDPGYPAPLKTIPSPPPVLYLKGTWEERDLKAIAIVGSRRATFYGRTVAEQLAYELASRGLTIISGMARGIDSAAHRGALAAGGRTIGVLGSGLGVIYPPENKALATKIATSGAVMSEFPFKMPPHRENFPRRNRLISGLSLGVVIVEADLQSGALITADHALEQGREVFAVPGNITAKTSRGCHKLIKQGAKLVETWTDVWEELKPSLGPSPAQGPQEALPLLAGEEGRLYRLLEEGPLHIDELIGRSGLTPSQVASLMLSLVMKGLVEELPGKVFGRRLPAG